MNAEVPIEREGATANISAEEQLLGALLMNNDVMDLVRTTLKPEYFSAPLHQKIFETVQSLMDRGDEANAVTILPYLDGDALVDEHTTVKEYLAALISASMGAYNAKGFSRAIIGAWQRRRLVDVGLGLAEDARFGSFETEPEILAQAAGEQLAEIINISAGAKKPRQYGEILLSAVKAAQDRRNDESGLIRWFLPEVNDVVGGVRPGNLIGLMSDSGGGKTSFAVSQCRFAAEVGVPSAFLSIEVTEEEAALQMAAQRLRVSMSEIDDMDLLKGKTGELMDEIEQGQRLSLAIEPFDKADLKSIGATIGSLKKRIGLKFVMIDHAKMIDLPGGRNDIFAERVNGLYRGLKAIAKASGVAIVILIQRNDDWKRRNNPMPVPSDAYGGGAVKQNLDAFFSLYRPSALYADKLDTESSQKERDRLAALIERTKGYAWIVNHKRRRGAPLGKRRIRFDAPFTLFLSEQSTGDEIQELPF